MKFLKGLAIFILTIALYVSIASILFLLPLRNAINKDTIKEAIINLNIEKTMNENPKAGEKINEALEPIYEKAQEYGIKKDIVIKIIDTKEIKNLFGEVTSNVIDYILTGKNRKIIESEEINNFVSNAIDEINDLGYYTFSEHEKENILIIVQDIVDEFQDAIPNTSDYDEVIKNNPKTKDLMLVKTVLSDKFLTYFIVGVIISVLGLLLLKWKECKWIKSIAITTLLSSITIITGTILILSLGNKISSDIPLIMDILTNPLNYSLNLSMIIFIVMIVVLIIYGIIHKIIIKNLKKAD